MERGEETVDASGKSRVPADRALAALPLFAVVAANAAAGTLFAWSVLLGPISSDLGVGSDDLSAIFSSALVTFALAVTVSGRAVDRFGPRRITGLASVLSGLGLGVAGMGSQTLLLYVGIGVLFGVGSGLTYLSVVAWASAGTQGRAWVVAVVVAAYAAGPVLGAPLGALGVEHVGWRATLVTAGIAVAGVIWLGSRGIPARREESAGNVTRSAGKLEHVGALVALWVLFLGMFTPGLLAFAHAASIAVERGISPDGAGLVVSLMALGNVVGRLLTALLATSLTLRDALWVTLVALALTLVLLASLSSAAIVVLGLSILGVQYGAASALVPMATRAISGKHRFATAYGRVFSSWGVAAVLGPSVVAALHETGDGYVPAFRVSLLAIALATPALVLVQPRLKPETDRARRK